MDYKCELIKSSYIAEHNEKTESDDRKIQKERRHGLGMISQHQVDNTFDNIDFGENLYGITLACPVDLVHLFLEGTLKYSIECFLPPDQS